MTEHFALDGRNMRVLTWTWLALGCAAPLYLRFVPMVDLPQYAALARMLAHLRDPRFEFGHFYELALERSLALSSLATWAGLGELLSPRVATRIMACASVAAYPLALCALLRALGKPIALALLGAPLVYASPFFLGLVPSSLSAGLALLVIARLASRRQDARARASLALLCALLSLTHPFGVAIASSYVACVLATRRKAEPPLPWLSLSPLLLGAAYWVARLPFADGVAAFAYPNLALRLLQLPEQILGGFAGRGEPWLLAGTIVGTLYLRRRGGIFTSSESLSPAERALRLLTWLSMLGYLLLPGSTWTTTAINVRAGWLAFALLPALVPAVDPGRRQGRAASVLLVLAFATTGYTTRALLAFDAEARDFEPILARVPARPKLIALTYDYRGVVARGAPYLHFASYVQAERGGALALSLADVAWTVPLRRRAGNPAPPPVYGSEWDPTLIQVQPYLFDFYDTVLVRGKDADEMTIFMQGPFKLVARSGQWLLYLRPRGTLAPRVSPVHPNATPTAPRTAAILESLWLARNLR